MAEKKEGEKKEGEKKKYSSRTVERYVMTKIPKAKKGQTIRQILSNLEKESNTYDSVDNVYIVNESDELIGVVSLREIFNNPLKTPIEKLIKTNLVYATSDMEVEKIADLALRHDLKAIPVVENKKLIGTVPSRKVISIVNKALKEDIFHFAGIHKSHLEFENSFEVPAGKALKSRLPWLITGLLGALLMAMFIHSFEETLATYVIIAAFIPAIVYMSGALSTQVITILIRDFAVLGKSMNMKLYIARQMVFTFFISAIIFVIMLVIVSIIWNEVYISFVISLATFISLLVTTFISILIAVFIRKFKFDPAMGSGPMATLISDMSSVVIYFIVVVLMI
jgi:magnesium transporter